MSPKLPTVSNQPTLLPLAEDEQLAAPLRRVLEDLELVLRGPMHWESGALFVTAATLERAAQTLVEIEDKIMTRVIGLRQQRAYLVRKAKAFRLSGRAALPIDRV